MSHKEFQDLSVVGYSGGTKESVPPEKEFFHNIYIAGITRKNHLGIEEQADKLQIRGHAYNLDSIHMIITHIKDVLVKVGKKDEREFVECFSFKTNPEGPWFGTTKMPDGRQRMCPPNSLERAKNDFCNPCKTQLIVAGILCDENGTPVLKQNEETGSKELVFVFIRARGAKFSAVSDYLNSLSKMDLDPIFTPATPQSLEFEKAVVNHKRFVTKVSIGSTATRYGNKRSFKLERGVELDKNQVLQLLNVAKKVLDKFSDKFDWSKKNNIEVEEEFKLDEKKVDLNSSPPATTKSKPFSFDDISF